MKESTSFLFRCFLFFLLPFRRPYLWIKSHWNRHKKQLELNQLLNLDTSRMLKNFNFLHLLFFRRSHQQIRFDLQDLDALERAYGEGRVVFLMRNWGQIEYNYFNQLFLKSQLPLVQHNNMVKMGHWMPLRDLVKVWRQKIDYYFERRTWLYNSMLFDMSNAIQSPQPVLYCLDLPRRNPWVESSLSAQTKIMSDIQTAQEKSAFPIFLVPIHFIYDKHPGKSKRSIFDIFFGEPDQPGYLRKIFLFLRNYKKRAVAKIGQPINLLELELNLQKSESREEALLNYVKKSFDQESKQVTGPKLKSRRKMISEILNSDSFQIDLQKLVTSNGLSLETTTLQISKYLREIVSDINFKLIELWGYFLQWLFQRFYNGLTVDRAGIQAIKKIAKDSAIVFVPAHRSHVDYLLLSFVFYHNDLSLPYVCAGNNLSFWPMGPIFRKSGAYFIRRSFAGDKVYGLALKSYIELLMQEGYFQEFFIEGTRSRSGKLFPPKLGLLSMMLDIYWEGKIPDIYFVPVSIDYERILEEGSYLKEVKGEQKKNERWMDLLKLPRFLKKRYGTAYVQFAQPISFRQFQDEALLQNPATPRRELTQSFAFKILSEINEVTTLMPSALVATALLSPYQSATTRDEVKVKAVQLLELAKSQNPRLSIRLEKNLDSTTDEVIEYFIAEKWLETPKHGSGNALTLSPTFRERLNFLKNQNLHFFVDVSIAKLCFQKTSSDSSLSWRLVRDLFEREFFLNSQSMPIVDAKTPDWVGEIIKPILESYWLTLSGIQSLEFHKIEEWLLVRKILELGEAMRLKGELVYPESLSRFNIQNALHQFTSLSILKNHQEDMGPSGRRHYSMGPEQGLRESYQTLLKVLLS